MPDLTLLIGAQDAIRAQNLTDAQRHISAFLAQSGCTGAIDADGTLLHDGATCPIHESGDVRRELVNLMLKNGINADELHADVDASVKWIENHPTATQFNYVRRDA